MITVFRFVAFLLLAAGTTVARAAETDQPMFKFGVFGTLGLSHSSMPYGDYVLDSTVPNGAGRSQDWSAGNDTRIAVQATANFTPHISAAAQLISEYQADGTYLPDFEWANVKYAFTPNAYIRVGRTTLPTFLNSDHRDVGYSYPWVHPPLELYRQLAILSSDGVDAMYRHQFGEVGNSLRAIYGSNTIDRPTSVSTSRDMWGIFDTLEYGSTTLHAGYQMRESQSHSLVNGSTGAWIKNSDFSLGASYDPGNWFAMTEWIQRKSTTKIAAMYVSAGYRINKFTPYLTYSQNSPGSFLPGFPAPTSGSIRSARKSQSAVSLGARWDFMRNTDFKLQYDQVRLSADSNGLLANVPTGVILHGSKFHVITAAVDFVF